MLASCQAVLTSSIVIQTVPTSHLLVLLLASCPIHFKEQHSFWLEAMKPTMCTITYLLCTPMKGMHPAQCIQAQCKLTYKDVHLLHEGANDPLRRHGGASGSFPPILVEKRIATHTRVHTHTHKNARLVRATCLHGALGDLLLAKDGQL
eukprot:scaffold114513_cov18-Tisochrysis_lutea.AAC.6